MKPTIYCVGLIYNAEGTRAGLFTFQGRRWPCMIKMKGVDRIAERFKEVTEKLFEQPIEWQNVKPIMVNWSILPCRAKLQIFKTYDTGLMYACEHVGLLEKIPNNEIIELLKENSFI